MDILSLYRRLLKLPPYWRVERVELDDQRERVDIWIAHDPRILFSCPECGRPFSVYDHAEERCLRHLDSCEHGTWIHVRIPRINCPIHGIRQVAAPGVVGSSGLTVGMEIRAIDTLAECSREGASRLLGLSWDESDGVLERAVARGLERRNPELPPWLGIDEKEVFARHKYFTVITGFNPAWVLEVIDGRRIADVEPWFVAHETELKDVAGFAMDMSAAYAGVVVKKCPDAEICYDHFHVFQKVTAAVDEVRKEEQKTLGDDEQRAGFFRSRYLFLYNEENVPEHRAEDFERAKAVAVKTSRAWAIKEDFRNLWACKTVEEAEAFFKRWYWWATHSRLEPMREAAKTLKRHWTGIANAIARRISNACTEGFNNKIERIKRDACGFRNKAKLRTAILFHCGGLDLYPNRN